MKYGVFGGTFDPPHLGHLEVARAALAHLELDEVIFVPAARNPLKYRTPSKPSHRMRMTELLVANEPQMSVSDIEISRGGPSYMVETIQEFSMARPGEFWLILGTDSLKTLRDWSQVDRLTRMVRYGVVIRPPVTLGAATFGFNEEMRDRCDEIPMSPNPVTSTQIRDEIIRGLDVEHLLTPEVWEYINKHGLYRE
jgi:nicotinate-nucleotide adenylyltransferase